MSLLIPKDWKETTKNNYNQHAEEFASFTNTYIGKLEKWINYFSNNLPKESSVLDVGCGAGRDASYFAQKGLLVTGIDFSEKLIEIAKKKAPSGKFSVMDFEKLSFPKNSFDGVWASASLLHIPKNKLSQNLEKINLILKKNGLFFSLFRVGKGEKITKEKRGNAILERFYAYYKPEEILDLLKKAGFKNIEWELDNGISGDWIGIFARK